MKTKMNNTINKKTKLLLFTLIIFWIFACGTTKTLVFHGSSMEPTISDGEKIFSIPVKLEELKRGDIVYFIEPLSGEGLVKRLIGLPGENIEITDGIVYINGNPLIEDYVTNPATYKLDSVSLKNNEYFVLGDNRNASTDSHILGSITGESIQGIIIQ